MQRVDTDGYTHLRGDNDHVRVLAEQKGRTTGHADRETTEDIAHILPRIVVGSETWYTSRLCYSVVPTVLASPSFARFRSCNQSQLSQKRFTHLLPVRCTILPAAELFVNTPTPILMSMSRRSLLPCKAHGESRTLLRAVSCCVTSDLPK